MAAQADFWGEIAPASIRTPVSLLREQASLLGKRTNYLLEARVETSAAYGDFTHRLVLVAPALSDYEYELLKIRHGIDLYPVFDAKTSKQMDDEDEFTEWLRERLSSPQTRRVVENLLAMANS
jgi:hypothetical protein